jgi:GDP-4-dehydro-6-deoxy-D-mannose reductase
MTVALITGGFGFVGGHLCRELRSRGWSVVAVGRAARTDAVGHTARPGTAGQPHPDGPHSDGRPHSDGLVVDVADPAAMAECLADVRPDVVFHLAATSTGPDVVARTVAASLGLGEGLRRAGRPGVRVVHAGSSAQYGAAGDNPVTEDTLPAPVSPYGYAKLAAEAALLGLAASGGFEVIPVRAFNHIGPGESPATVGGAFATRIRDVLAGRASRVTAAGLDSVRDFTDVRDIVRGYADLAERGMAGRLYNLCSGRPTTVAEVLDALLACAGLDRSVVDLVPTPPNERSARVAYQVGSPVRVQHEVGWTATIGLEQSAKDLLEGLT